MPPLQTPKLVLRVCIPLLGRFAIPPSSFDIVPRHASADVVHEAEIELCYRLPAPLVAAIPVVLWHSCPAYMPVNPHQARPTLA